MKRLLFTTTHFLIDGEHCRMLPLRRTLLLWTNAKSSGRRLASMSFAPTYSYVSASDLAKAWKEQQGSTSQRRIAIVDVRDDDFEGGHIKGCINVPSNEFPHKVQQLVLGPLKDASQVIFHCSLSQARGPKAARMYSEARAQAQAEGKLSSKDEQKVQVLRDGFSNFGQQYKNDPDLVEDYDEEAWKYR